MHTLVDELTAAAALNMHPRTLTKWRWEGKGPPYCKIGRSVRYSLTDLETFVEKSRIAAND